MIDPHDLTQRGIEAIQSGDRTYARMLLLEAIELDGSIEMAWLWLAETIDDPHDQIVALENVLTLNPDNAEAHKRLEALRSPQKIVALPADDDITINIYQCVYCGEPTTHETKRCPHCGEKLVAISGLKKRPAGPRTIIGFLGGFSTILSALLIAPSIIARGEMTMVTEQVISWEWVPILFTDFMSWPAAVVETLLVVITIRTIVFFVIAIGWVNDKTVAYIVALGLLPIDILMLAAGYRQGYISAYVLPVQLLMDGTMLFFVMLSNSLYAGYAVRELTRMQHASRSAGELYNLGHKFSRERKWALATLYWQKATVLDSYKAAYFQQLGIGYAQINRYPRALQALRDARRLEPENAKIKQALALVERRVKQQRSNKKKTGEKKKRT